MQDDERQRGASLADRALKLNLIGTTTHLQVRALFDPGTPWKSAKQVFRGMGVLTDVEFAVVGTDWEQLGAQQRFRDDLLILRTLGEGGMGVVYQALDTNLDRIVAIKVIRPEKLVKDGASRILLRFQREATVLAQLRERTIVRLFEAKLTPEGCPYLVMEFVPGNSLSTVIKRVKAGEPIELALRPPKTKLASADGLGLKGAGALDVRQVAEWGRSLAEGLHAVHGLGIIHRDVKPGNVLISETGEALLIDFGVAFDVNGERLTEEATTVGTALYMAPELIGAEPPDATTDVYALGATLYEALCGQPPFDGNSAIVICTKVLRGVIPPLRGEEGLRPDVPEALEAIVLKCLCAESADRYPTAKALAEDLRRFLDASPVDDAPPEPTRSPAIWLALVGLVLVVALVIVASLAAAR